MWCACLNREMHGAFLASHLCVHATGLFAYAPVAPTVEMLRLLAEVEEEAGPVKHVLLPSLAIEHKIFAGDFARARPDVQV